MTVSLVYGPWSDLSILGPTSIATHRNHVRDRTIICVLVSYHLPSGLFSVDLFPGQVMISNPCCLVLKDCKTGP